MVLSRLLVKLTSMRPDLQSQNCVYVCYGKTFCLGAQLKKPLWKSNISQALSQLEKSLATKLTNWRPFKLQKFKWLLRAQFLSHTLQILKINLSFEAVKMILLYLIKISFSFRYKKNENEFSFHLVETSMIYIAEMIITNWKMVKNQIQWKLT